MLPSEIFDYFSVVGVKRTSTETHIHLDGLMNSTLSHEVNFESKGFMEAVSVTNFPIRDHEVFLKNCRRRRNSTRTGKSFSIPVNLDVVCKGIRHFKEFGAFFKRDVWRHPR